MLFLLSSNNLYKPLSEKISTTKYHLGLVGKRSMAGVCVGHALPLLHSSLCCSWTGPSAVTWDPVAGEPAAECVRALCH